MMQCRASAVTAISDASVAHYEAPTVDVRNVKRRMGAMFPGRAFVNYNGAAQAEAYEGRYCKREASLSGPAAHFGLGLRAAGINCFWNGLGAWPGRNIPLSSC